MNINKLSLLCFTAIMLILFSACADASKSAAYPLEGTSWELVAYRKSQPISGTSITMTFKDGQVNGSAGCNSYFGSYQVSAEKIEVSPLGITEMFCMQPEGVMDQELMFTAMLIDAQTFKLADGRLQIYFSNHETLTFDQAERQ